MPFEYDWKVRSGDTDFSGLIYTAAVIDCMVEGLQDMMAAAGWPQQRALSEGVLYPVAHAEADYLAPVEIEDVIAVSLTPDPGDSSVTIRGTGIVEGTTVFEGELTLVFIDEDGDSVPIPADARRGLQEFSDS